MVLGSSIFGPRTPFQISPINFREQDDVRRYLHKRPKPYGCRFVQGRYIVRCGNYKDPPNEFYRLFQFEIDISEYLCRLQADIGPTLDIKAAIDFVKSIINGKLGDWGSPWRPPPTQPRWYPHPLPRALDTQDLRQVIISKLSRPTTCLLVPSLLLPNLSLRCIICDRPAANILCSEYPLLSPTEWRAFNFGGPCILGTATPLCSEVGGACKIAAEKELCDGELKKGWSIQLQFKEMLALAKYSSTCGRFAHGYRCGICDLAV